MIAMATLLGNALLQRQPLPSPPLPPEILTAEEEAAGASQVSTGFDFTRSYEGNADFLLQADRVLDSEGEAYILDSPSLERRHDDGTWTHARARRGTFDPATEAGRLEGEAHAITSGGLEVEADALLYRAAGEGMTAEGVAHFSRQGLRGHGRGMRFDSDGSLLTLESDVHIEGEPPAGKPGAAWVLDSESLAYRTELGELATGAFTLDGDQGDLRGDHLDLQIDPETNEPQEMTATGNAELLEHPAGPGAERARLAGDRIVIEPDPEVEQPRRIEATGAATLCPGRAREEGVREIAADRIEILRQAEARRFLDAAGTVVLELEDGGLLHSDEFQATLGPDTEVLDGVARGQVRFHDDDGSEARSHAARFEAAGGRLILTGTEETPPVLTTPERRVSARRILMERAAGAMLADGDVRTVSSSEAEAAGLFQAGEPVYATADFLRAVQDGDRAVYQGAVRLWQGENLLQADRVEILREAGVLQAEGRVLTRAQVEGEEGPRWTQGIADRFRYRDREGVALYEGSAQLDMGAEQVSGEWIEVTLSEAREVTLVIAEGDVTVALGAHKGVGDRLEYRPAEDLAILHGIDRLAEAQDIVNQRLIRGRTLTFHLADGRIEVDSEPGGRTWITLSPGQEGTPVAEENGGR